MRAKFTGRDPANRRPRTHLQMGLWLALSVVLGGCRDLNPRFQDGQIPVALTGEQGEDSQDPSSDEDEDEDDDTSQPDEDSSDDHDDTQTPSFEYGKFCDNGPLMCVPVLKSDPRDRVTSHGSMDPRFKFGESGGTTGINDASHPRSEMSDPLARALFTSQSGPGIVSTQDYIHQGQAFGVDLWFLPDLARGDNWTVVEFDGLVAIYQLQAGTIHCRMLDEDDGDERHLSASIDFTHVPADPEESTKEESEFVHVACSIDESGQMRLSVGRSIDATTESFDAMSSFAPALVRLGRGGPLSKASGNFSGRIASIRTWQDPQIMHDTNEQELNHICEKLHRCH